MVGDTMSDQPPLKQFLCIKCGELVQNCTCPAEDDGKAYETDLAWRQWVRSRLNEIDSKMTQLAQYFEAPFMQPLSIDPSGTQYPKGKVVRIYACPDGITGPEPQARLNNLRQIQAISKTVSDEAMQWLFDIAQAAIDQVEPVRRIEDVIDQRLYNIVNRVQE